MTPAAALAALAAAGVHAALQGDGTVRLKAALPPPLDVLALARAHRDGIAALLAERAHQAARAGLPPLPGLPPDWTEGVALLAGRPAPDGITAPRWRAFQATTVRLLHDHGAELHNAGWDTLDLFGLHATAPATNAPGWGLAWLLGAAGEVLDVSPTAVGMMPEAGGARLAYRKTQTPPRAGILPAWNLPGASA